MESITSRLVRRINNLKVEAFLIEDDDLDILVATEVLESLGATVTLAKNGQFAIEYLKSNRPSIVFCDLRLPGVDGVGVLHFLKVTYPDVPTIILTGLSSPNDLLTRAADLGYISVVTKPLTSEIAREIFVKHRLI